MARFFPSLASTFLSLRNSLGVRVESRWGQIGLRKNPGSKVSRISCLSPTKTFRMGSWEAGGLGVQRLG